MTLTLTREVVDGISLGVRDGTSDLMMVHSIVIGDEYRLRDRALSGWAIDLGAHIGVAAALMLNRNPDLSVIAIEPVPDNVAMLRDNLAPFGERAVVLAAKAGSGDVYHDYGGDPYADTNRFIGALYREDVHGGTLADVPTVTLAELVAEHGDITLLKTDCEGGEYAFLSDPEANTHVQTIVGEWHDDNSGTKIKALLERTHDFTHFTDGGGVGLFEAVRR